jgi:hypothetical protein
MMLDAGRGIIASALKTLEARWDVVEPRWQDAMRLQFVRQVWEPLHAQLAAALEAVDAMQVHLYQMRRECEGTNYDIHQGN